MMLQVSYDHNVFIRREVEDNIIVWVERATDLCDDLQSALMRHPGEFYTIPLVAVLP